MVRLETCGPNGTLRIWLQPNRALGWSHNRRLLWLYLGVGLVSATQLAWAGYWPVGGFILLTTALLIAATLATLGRLSWQECIQLTPEQIRLQRGRRAAEHECSCARAAARLHLLIGTSPWQAPRLLLKCGASDWELGRDLSASDRRHLSRLLRDSGIASVREAHAISAIGR